MFNKFQFLLVRLKDNGVPEFRVVTIFQFLLVRLKEEGREGTERITIKFQFLLVRLKAKKIQPEHLFL